MRPFIPLTILVSIVLVGDQLFTSAARFGAQHEDMVEDAVAGVAEMQPDTKIPAYEHPNKRSRVKHEKTAAVEGKAETAAAPEVAEDEEDVIEAGDEQEMEATQEKKEQFEAELAEAEEEIAEIEEAEETIKKQGNHRIKADEGEEEMTQQYYGDDYVAGKGEFVFNHPIKSHNFPLRIHTNTIIPDISVPVKGYYDAL
jgi:hypothetical protein